jgi:hypothetical protein
MAKYCIKKLNMNIIDNVCNSFIYIVYLEKVLFVYIYIYIYMSVNYKLLNDTLTKTRIEPDDLQYLYDFWNSLDESTQKELEVGLLDGNKPTNIKKAAQGLYANIETNKAPQKAFAMRVLLPLMKKKQDMILPVMGRARVGVDDDSYPDMSPEFAEHSRDVLETTFKLIERIDTAVQYNFLRKNAELIGDVVVNIVNLMLLIFCSFLALSRLLSREDIRRSPDIREKIGLLNKAIMQYYTNILSLFASLTGFHNFARKTGAKPLTWSESMLLVSVFMGVYGVLSFFDPNGYIINVVMFPISFPIYCTEQALSLSGINFVNMFWSRVFLITDKLSEKAQELISDKIEYIYSLIENRVMQSVKAKLISWLTKEGSQIIVEQVKVAVEGAAKDAIAEAVPQITGAVSVAAKDAIAEAVPQITDALAGVVSDAVPQITDAIQSELVIFQSQIEQLLLESSTSCPVISPELLSRLETLGIQNDPTIFDSFSQSLNWWGTAVRDQTIKTAAQLFIEYKGRPFLAIRGGRKSRKNRKMYKNKTRKNKGKKTHKRYRKAKRVRKSKKY